MAIEKIEKFGDEILAELLPFLAKWSPDHPELAEGDSVIWQKSFKFISRYHGAISGFIAQIPQIFRYGKKSGREGIEHIGWSVTLVVDNSGTAAAARRRSAFTHELLTAVENNPPWRFTAVGVVPEIEEPYRRRGHVVRRDCVKMYARFFRPGVALKYYGKNPILKIPLYVANVIYPAPKISSSLEIVKINQFDPSFDKYWARYLNDSYELYGERNAEFLNYKISQPKKEYLVYQYGEQGYIVFRKARHRTKDLFIIRICDLVGTMSARKELLKLAVKYALDSKADGIVAVGSIYDETLLKKGGLYLSMNYPIAMSPDIKAKMHVTFFDADLDNLW